jgi:hypothetical protein
MKICMNNNQSKKLFSKKTSADFIGLFVAEWIKVTKTEIPEKLFQTVSSSCVT